MVTCDKCRMTVKTSSDKVAENLDIALIHSVSGDPVGDRTLGLDLCLDCREILLEDIKEAVEASVARGTSPRH